MNTVLKGVVGDVLTLESEVPCVGVRAYQRCRRLDLEIAHARWFSCLVEFEDPQAVTQ